MKRDMGLVREILLALENAHLEPDQELQSPGLAKHLGRSHWDVLAHIELMQEAGLLRAFPTSEGRGRELWISGITWDGYDFLDAVRSDRVMAKLTEVATPLGGIPFAVLKELAIESVKELVGLGTRR